MDKNALIELIQGAFESNNYPGDDNIDIGHPLSIKDFIGIDRSDVTPGLLRRYQDSLHLLSREGLRYFLPSILVTMIKHPDKVDAAIRNIVTLFCPPELVTDEDEYRQAMMSFNSRMSLFTATEKHAIAYFIVSYKDMFPEENWKYIDNRRNELNRTIEYWRSYITSK